MWSQQLKINSSHLIDGVILEAFRYLHSHRLLDVLFPTFQHRSKVALSQNFQDLISSGELDGVHLGRWGWCLRNTGSHAVSQNTETKQVKTRKMRRYFHSLWRTMTMFQILSIYNLATILWFLPRQWLDDTKLVELPLQVVTKTIVYSFQIPHFSDHLIVWGLSKIRGIPTKCWSFLQVSTNMRFIYKQIKPQRRVMQW